METKLSEIATLCASYAQAREQLAGVTEKIRMLRRQAVRRHLGGLRERIADVSVAHESLREAVEANPELFATPRTRSLEGVKVGYRKLPGKVECDEARAIERIRKHCPAREAALVRVRESLNRAALKQLDAKTLSALGVSIVEVDDEVVIAAAGDDLDALVEALLGDLDPDVEQAA